MTKECQVQSYKTKQVFDPVYRDPVSDLTEVRSMLLPFGYARRRIYGGPYRHKPLEMAGVKLAPEVEGGCTVFLPIRDFNVPTHVFDVDWAIIAVLHMLARKEKDVFVGCFGGKGRTGLFLALLAKSVGVTDPVGYVRANYRPEAVETPAQRMYVENYVPPLTMVEGWGLVAKALLRGPSPRI